MSSDLNPKLPNALDMDAVRAKLAQEDGKRFWQSIDQLALPADPEALRRLGRLLPGLGRAVSEPAGLTHLS